MMGDYNIHLFMEKVFTDREVLEVKEIYELRTGHNVPIALWPFLSHDTLVETLRKAKFEHVRNNRLGASDNFIQKVEKFIDKLDEDNYWVDISTIGDRNRKEYNTVTGIVRYIPYDGTEIDLALFGNVRKAM